MTAAEWIARARAVTDAATEGPWEAVGGPYIEAAGDEFAEVCMDVDGSDDERAPIDAAFIAASRTMLPAAVAAIEAVMALHRATEVEAITDPICCSEECGHDGDCPTEPVAVCLACDDMCESAYEYYSETKLNLARYPCPTVRTITAALGEDPS